MEENKQGNGKRKFLKKVRKYFRLKIGLIFMQLGSFLIIALHFGVAYLGLYEYQQQHAKKQKEQQQKEFQKQQQNQRPEPTAATFVQDTAKDNLKTPPIDAGKSDQNASTTDSITDQKGLMGFVDKAGLYLFDFFSGAHLNGEEFFRQLFRNGIFLYFTFFALYSFGVHTQSFFKTILGLFTFSVAIATLLAADRAIEEADKALATKEQVNLRRNLDSLRSNPDSALISKALAATGTDVTNASGRIAVNPAISVNNPIPSTFSSVLYVLLTRRYYLLILTAFTLVLLCYFVYHISRHIFKMEYTGSGIQIRLPGQTIYYMPIYPQISWQNTGIQLREGDKYSVEISGFVSPGGIQDTKALNDHMAEFVEIVAKKGNPIRSYQKLKDLVWPYTGPSGYKRKWYGPDPNKQLTILKKHPIYKQPRYFEEDDLLTVQGMPHNKVIGFIRGAGELAPKKSDGEKNRPAYLWKKDKDVLINFSCNRYPVDFSVPRSGELYVVINDVDMARWDNSGLFFLKLTKTTI